MATETTKNLNLYQRLLRAQEAVLKVQPTGHNQFKATAISIADVEGAVGPALTEQGVVTVPNIVELVDIAEGKLWRIKIEIDFINADDPADHRVTGWENIGGNPDAASSFARKAIYKGMLHIVEDDEAGANTVATHNGQRVNRSTGEIREGRPTQAPLAKDERPSASILDGQIRKLVGELAVNAEQDPAAILAWLKDSFGLKPNQHIQVDASDVVKAEMIATLKERLEPAGATS